MNSQAETFISRYFPFIDNMIVRIISWNVFSVTIGVLLFWCIELKEKGPSAQTIFDIAGDTGPWALFLSLCLAVLCEIHIFNKNHKKNTEKLIQSALKNSKVVLEMPIEPFDQIYIKMMQVIMIWIENVNDVYALDSSPPSRWWSNSMLGYLAVQVNWVSKELKNKLHRFFVMTESDFQSLQGTKIITLQILMGINVYLMTHHTYNSLLKQYNMIAKENDDGNEVKDKEFFTWDKNDSIFIKKKIDKFTAHDVYGYQSTWSVGTPYPQRANVDFTDINGKLRDGNAYPAYKTEFITDSTKMHAKGYTCFAKFLIKKAVSCTKDSIAKKENIIQIPSMIDGEKKPMEVDMIRDILIKFCEPK